MILDDLAKDTIDRYSNRFKKLGKDVKTLGWGSDEQQMHRFSQVTKNIKLKDKSVLDIGCGFGDFYEACINQNQEISSYIGWDINPDLIDKAKELHSAATFDVINLSKTNNFTDVAQIGVMLGVLNLNFADRFDNLEFSKMMIKNAFNAVSECLVVDFISDQLTPEYPAEDFIYYHSPSQMLEFALSLTSSVKLLHDYRPIPQKEFMLVLEHV